MAVTQWIVSNREGRRWDRERDREDDRWARDREHERIQWDHEAAQRWHDQRSTIYVGALRHAKAWRSELESAMYRLTQVGVDADPPNVEAAREGWLTAIAEVEIFGSDEARRTAGDLSVRLLVAHAAVVTADPDDLSGVQRIMAGIGPAYEQFRMSVRLDLGLMPSLPPQRSDTPAAPTQALD